MRTYYIANIAPGIILDVLRRAGFGGTMWRAQGWEPGGPAEDTTVVQTIGDVDHLVGRLIVEHGENSALLVDEFGESSLILAAEAA